jgi:hypothetical protein
LEGPNTCAFCGAAFQVVLTGENISNTHGTSTAQARAQLHDDAHSNTESETDNHSRRSLTAAMHTLFNAINACDEAPPG